MNWFVKHRQDWIREMLAIYGFINRAHLIRKFGVSVPQASNDLTMFNRSNPGAMFYDNRRKAYFAANETGPRVGIAADRKSE